MTALVSKANVIQLHKIQLLKRILDHHFVRARELEEDEPKRQSRRSKEEGKEEKPKDRSQPFKIALTQKLSDGSHVFTSTMVKPFTELEAFRIRNSFKI